jgi:hypothetical protein
MAQPAESDTMILLTYTPRADSVARGYEDWLRRVDNPFFNGVPGIVRYMNWKVVRQAGAAPGFGWFDFMLIENAVAADLIWKNPDVVKFTAGWRELWGLGPQADDLSINAHVYLAQRHGPRRAPIGERIVLIAGDAPADDVEQWRVARSIRGTQRFAGYSFAPLAGENAFDAWRARAETWRLPVLEAVCVAQP